MALHVCQFFIYGSFTVFLILKEKSYSYYYSNIFKIHVCFTFLFLFLVHKLMYSDTTIIIPECFLSVSCLQPWTWIARLNIVWGDLHTQPLNSTGCHMYSTNSLCLLPFSSLKETCCCPFLSDFMIKPFIYHHPGLCPASSMFLHRMLLPCGGPPSLVGSVKWLWFSATIHEKGFPFPWGK